MVLSLGVNDTADEDGAPRVSPADSIATWRALLGDLRGVGWPVLAVGPPPVADADHVGRVLALDVEYRAACAPFDIPYVGVASALRDDEVWAREVSVGDGSHPGAAGYDRLANLIWPAWWSWLAT